MTDMNLRQQYPGKALPQVAYIPLIHFNGTRLLAVQLFDFQPVPGGVFKWKGTVLQRCYGFHRSIPFFIAGSRERRPEPAYLGFDAYSMLFVFYSLQQDIGFIRPIRPKMWRFIESRPKAHTISRQSGSPAECSRARAPAR